MVHSLTVDRQVGEGHYPGRCCGSWWRWDTAPVSADSHSPQPLTLHSAGPWSAAAGSLRAQSWCQHTAVTRLLTTGSWCWCADDSAFPPCHLSDPQSHWWCRMYHPEQATRCKDRNLSVKHCQLSLLKPTRTAHWHTEIIYDVYVVK